MRLKCYREPDPDGEVQGNGAGTFCGLVWLLICFWICCCMCDLSATTSNQATTSSSVKSSNGIKLPDGVGKGVAPANEPLWPFESTPT